MFKVVFSVLASFVVTTSVCSAADLDAVDHYSFDPVTMSALDYAVMPLAATSWDTSDQAHLAAIRNALTVSSSTSGGSILYNLIQIRSAVTDTTDSGYLKDIRDAFYLNKSAVDGSIVESVRDITTIRDALLGASGSLTQPSQHSIFYYIYNLASLPEIKSDTQYIEDYSRSIDGTTQSLLSYWTQNSSFGHGFINSQGNYISEGTYGPYKLDYILKFAGVSLTHDGVLALNKEKTVYSLIKQLQQVLASDDDLALANSQKANREKIEDSFLTGSSGSTSLGASDFGDLADVGGTIKDSLSLDGNATIGSFTSGLAAADSAGQGWFSDETRSQLDAVSSTVTYSLRDPDPYNMAGWEDRYYWLLGDDE